MIEVTERARQELKRILNAKADLPQARLRLTSGASGQLGLGIDIEMPDDHIVEYEGTKVLIVEQGLASRLVGVTLDVQDTAEGLELVIDGEASGS
ncbi:MAG: adhesin [Chloroflexota bacterium]